MREDYFGVLTVITRRFTDGHEFEFIIIIGDTALIDLVWCYHATTACMHLKNCMVAFPLLDEVTRRLPHPRRQTRLILVGMSSSLEVIAVSSSKQRILFSICTGI
jgi:hypothetical protein